MDFLLVIILGLSIGSFLNVAVFRIRNKMPISRGRSKCMSCAAPIGVKDLIPVVSYLRLKGRCRGCEDVIPIQYPLVEIATAFLFVLFYHKWNPYGFFDVAYLAETVLPLIIRDWVFVGFLITIFVYDLKHMLILDRITIPAMIFALMAGIWIGDPAISSLLLGGLVLGGFFYVQFIVSKGTWVGGGDIRMGVLMGFMLGLTQGLVALFLAYVFGAVIGVFLLQKKKVKRKSAIAFGTFLSFSTTVVLLVGPQILSWYLGFFQ